MNDAGIYTKFEELSPFEIKTLDTLGLPAVVADLARFPRGFVVVTGPTGSGKSTTLAGMIDVVNTERAGHIMTVEDPIEFLHKHKKCIVNQREVGADTQGFGHWPRSRPTTPTSSSSTTCPAARSPRSTRR